MAEEKDRSLKEEESISEEVTDESVEETQSHDETVIEQGSEELNEAYARIEELEEQLASTKDSLLRKAAELENVRKRVQRERLQLFEEAKAGALEDFLPVSDDLIRTLEAAKETDVEENFLKGIQLVADKFSDVLNKHGVKRIDETGVPFDVNLHDAMMKQSVEDVESDMVLQVIESGFKIGDRTIRHAKVIVSE